MDVLNAMTLAHVNGGRFPPPGVEDTAANKQLWDKIGADIEAMRERGVQPDVRWEWTEGQR